MVDDKNMPITGHLSELRRILIVSLFSLLPATIGAYIYVEEILNILQKPLLDSGIKLIQTGITETLFTYIKLSVFIGLLIASPIIFQQLWSFISPALREEEKKYVYYFVPAAVFLFFAGVVFGYFTVFQIGVKFLIAFGAGTVDPFIKISEYVTFAISFLLPFGIVFELPLVILVLTKLGIISPQLLSAKRKYAVLVIFVIAALLTPGPDIISQALMAGPMFLLYEFSIFLSRFVKPRAIQGAYENEQEEPKEPKEQEADESKKQSNSSDGSN